MAWKVPEMIPDGVETFPGALGCCLAVKNDRNQLSGMVNLMQISQNLTARGWFWGYPTPKIGFERKDPGFSVS